MADLVFQDWFVEPITAVVVPKPTPPTYTLFPATVKPAGEIGVPVVMLSCHFWVPLVSSLESLDNSLIEAAYDLGAGGFSILRTIVIPHAAPGITAGCIVVFMLTLGNYLTPTLLGGKNSQWFTEQIYTQFITRFNWEQGAAFGFLLLILSTAIVWAGLKVTGQRFGDVMRRT
jgi:ABC-type spermidine/putrescine transport system permease subunit I